MRPIARGLIAAAVTVPVPALGLSLAGSPMLAGASLLLPALSVAQRWAFAHEMIPPLAYQTGQIVLLVVWLSLVPIALFLGWRSQRPASISVPVLIAVGVAALIWGRGAAIVGSSQVWAHRVLTVAMAPALRPGDSIQLTASLDAPEVGDIVAYHPPDTPEKVWYRRVVAVAGQRVDSDERGLIIDGSVVAGEVRAGAVVDANCTEHPVSMVTESHSGSSWTSVRGKKRGPKALTVPADHVYLLADQRDVGLDSRFHGPVPTSRVVGVVRSVTARSCAQVGAKRGPRLGEPVGE
ncbi:MAG: signal peptidase I [Kiritimatiellia bacterium]